MKGTQNPSLNAKVQNHEIPVLRSTLSSEKRHNSPGTPVERLSLNTTVMLILSASFLLLSYTYCFSYFTFILIFDPVAEFCYVLFQKIFIPPPPPPPLDKL